MRKILILALVIELIAMASYIFFEPELTKAVGDISSISLTVITEITMSCDVSVTLSGTIYTISGGAATGSFTCLVKTPDSAGWNLQVKENNTLKTANGGANQEFTDYVENTPLDYSWSAPASGEEKFGFNIKAGSVDVLAKYMDNGINTCGSGAVSDDYCWNGFDLTDEKVASSSSATETTGDSVIFGLKAEAGSSNSLSSGSYTNTIVATATVGP